MLRTGNAQFYSEEHQPAHAAALMFAAGHTAAAISMLEAETAAGAGAEVLRQPWLVLFDLYHAAGRREAFDALLPRYARAFPGANAPAWGHPGPIDSPGTLQLSGVLERASDLLQRIQVHAADRRTMSLDMSQVQRIDFALVGDLAALLRRMHVQGKRVILANVSELHCAVLEAAGAEGDAVFMRRRGVPAMAPAHALLAAA